MSEKKFILPKLSIIILICLISILLLSVEFILEDELWNFNNVYKSYNGFLLYKDSNVIITPLFYYLGISWLHVFGANLISFRLYNIVTFILLYFVIYKILKKLKISIPMCIIYLFLIILRHFSLITAGANYNFLAILFVLLGIYSYLNGKISNWQQGFLLFLIFFTKQNTGAYYLLGILIYELAISGFSKKLFLNQFKKMIFFLIPSAILLFKLYSDGIFLDFINYAFGGLFDFGEKNFNFSADLTTVMFIIIDIAIFIFILLNRKKVLKELFSQEIWNNTILLFVFAFTITLTVFPLMNTAHFIIVIPLHLLFLFYVLNTLLLEEVIGTLENIKNISYIFVIIILAIIFIRLAFEQIQSLKTCSLISNSNSPFYGLIINSDLAEKNENLKKYIIEKNKNGIDVIIVSYEAGYPMAELKQSHGVYDLVFNGNLGYNGIEKIKQDILSRDNTEFLIFTSRDDLHFQDSREIRDFIIENLDFQREIDNYTVFSKSSKSK